MLSYMIFVNPKFPYIQVIIIATQPSFNCTHTSCQVLNFCGVLRNEMILYLFLKEFNDASRCASHKNDGAYDAYNFLGPF